MNMTRAGVQAFIRRSSATVRQIYAETVIIAGVSYQAAVAPAGKRSVIGSGGERLVSEISVRIPKTALANPPTQALLTWSGGRYQIETISQNQNDSEHYLQCYEYDS